MRSRPLRRDRRFYWLDPNLRLNHQSPALHGDDNGLSGVKTEVFQPSALQRELRRRIAPATVGDSNRPCIIKNNVLAIKDTYGCQKMMPHDRGDVASSSGLL